MNDGVDWKLLAKHLFGECSEEETAQVRAWIEEDPTREALLEELRQVWRMTRDPASSEPWDTEALWNRVQEQTQRQQEGEFLGPSRGPSAQVSDQTFRQEGAGRRSARLPVSRHSVRQAVGAGAIALVIAVVSVLWFRGALEDTTTDVAPKTKTFATQEGQRATVRLPDGTRVRLNADSRLTLGAAFGEEQRMLWLEGEAFFEVEEDSMRAFIVRAGGTVTRVLGTAFDVNAYPEIEGAKVLVAEGQVTLRSETPSAIQGEEELVLTRRQMGQILDNGEQVVREELNLEQHLAWMEGQLTFEEASFAEVVRGLERWYGLTIELAEDTAAPPGHLNAQFAEGQSLREVLSVIATAFGMEYERDQKRITFTLAEEPRSP